MNDGRTYPLSKTDEQWRAELSPEEYLDHSRLLAAIRAEDPATATAEAAAYTASCEAAR